MLIVLLELNKVDIELTDTDIIKIGFDVARGKMNNKQLHDYLKKSLK